MIPSRFHGIFSALSERESDQQSHPPEKASSRDMQAPRRPQGDVGRLAVDIYEQDSYLIVRAPIAGVRLPDIEIEVNDNILTIRGSRRVSEPADPGQYYLQECYFGPFERSVTLPFDVDARKVRATFNKECLLKILIPKEEKVKIVRISEG